MTKEKFYELYKEYKPIQDDNEMWPLIHDVLMPHKVSKILELGTEFGGSSIIWNQLCQEGNGFFIGVDGEPGRAQHMLYDSKTPVHMVAGNTMHDSTVQKVAEILNGEKVDFLFIDADHMDTAVYLDTKNYSQFVRDGGIIAYHDYGDMSGGPRLGITNAKKDGIISPKTEGEYIGRMGIYWWEK
jgi:predicted O-methyltransferase YrrM